jgi:deazaflavin-dependent oxidoreductase (nitroreductase family)
MLRLLAGGAVLLLTMERAERPWSERRKVLLEGHRRNPFTTTLTGGRVLSAVQLPWFALAPPSGYGVLTTRGRRTGKRRRKCVRAVRMGDRAFLVAIPGSAAAWIMNIRADPRVHLRMRGARLRGTAREVRDEQELQEAFEAYCGTTSFFDRGAFVLHWPGRPTASRIRELLELWFENGVVVAVDLDR